MRIAANAAPVGPAPKDLAPTVQPQPSTVQSASLPPAANAWAGVDTLERTARASPSKPGQPNRAYDGQLIGGDGNAYPAGTPFSEVPPTRPSNGPSKGTLIFVNGMGESRDSNQRRLQTMANGTGMDVVGLYNATEGTVKDLIQAAGDKTDLGKNPAVDALADLVFAKVMAGENVRIAGHSQGAIITSRALQDVKNRLMLEGGMTSAQAKAAMGRIGVETLGGAASSYPDGPRYMHYVNRGDFVPMALGLGMAGSDAGEGAKVVKFGWPNPLGLFGKSHSTETYFKHYQPFPA
ncbi:MAG: hypothetical protein M3Y59_11220 [Myxococcota bacterium]|nr:hypothetical protein [Myxococcota bacterium]